MEFVEGSTFDIPYFNGNIRHVPAALLREKSTGRTAYFLNVHNPANVRGHAATWRAKAIRIERAKVIELRKTGRPVFITGDFNDREKAFCPLTAGKLTISPNSIPSTTCAYPKQSLDRLDLRRRSGPLLLLLAGHLLADRRHQRPPGRPGPGTPAELITTAQ